MQVLLESACSQFLIYSNSMFAIIPITFIVVGLGIVILAVVKKFPQLTVLDVDALPEEQDRKKKERILEERFYRMFKPLGEKTQVVGEKIVHRFMEVQGSFREYVNQVADNYRSEHSKKTTKQFKQKSHKERAREVSELLDDADELRHDKELSRSEELYLRAIGLSPRSVRAYKGLGKIYFSQDKWKEARETFEYLVTLVKDDDIPHAFLGRIAKAEQRWEDAVKHYEKAITINAKMAKRHIDLAQVYLHMGDKVAEAKQAFQEAFAREENNPAVIDQIVQFAIQVKDGRLAKEMIAKLQEVNPQNKKLAEFKEKVRRLK